jgi:hypothetical protein
VRHPETGAIVYEEYCQYGRTHREDGAAKITHDIETGVIVHEWWCQNGLLHRLGAPACIGRNRVTGELTRQEYFFEGTSKGDYNYRGPKDELRPD